MRLRSQDSAAVEYTLKARGRSVRLSTTQITASPEETQHDFNKRIAAIAKLPLNRLRVTLETSNTVIDKRVHADAAPTMEALPGDETVLLVKDLGPQMSWRVVYVIEYLGPILFHPMFYYCQKFFYGHRFEHSIMQTVTLGMVVAHFIKRELETLFVHRFSADTMPFAYVFRNSAHYWALSGLVFGYVVYHPGFSHVKRTQNELVIALVAYAYAELSNFSTHMTLHNLRPAGSRTRQIPRGYGFDWPFGGISFPNYFFEVLAWVVVGVWSGCWGVIPFIVVATVTMDNWAQGKHRKYKKEFPDYPKRKAMFPWIR